MDTSTPLMSLDDYRSRYPLKTITLSNHKQFHFRFYDNPDNPTLLVLMNGGLGVTDLFYLHFVAFAKNFSVLTFDYDEAFPTITELGKVVAALLTRYGRPTWLIGNSTGGIFAQIIAKEHPTVETGMVLANTSSLSKSMSPQAYRSLKALLDEASSGSALVPFAPTAVVRSMAKNNIMSEFKDAPATTRERALRIANEVVSTMPKSYADHMLSLLQDAEGHFGMVPEDFAHLKGHVLLVLTGKDDVFSKECQESLIDIMPDPEVVHGLPGGYFKLIVDYQNYVETVTTFIKAHP